ncbi:MAG: 16S rRNA (cytosine(1402)-N(4))-methyltransferase RsmH [Candidatus Falkowbacteria bacterium]
MEYKHIPVMLTEVISGLEPRPGQILVDCTLGGAGYTLALSKMVGPTGQVVALDLDDLAISHAREKIEQAGVSNVFLFQDNFRNLEKVIKDNFPEDFKVDGVVLDLGLSSAQLEDTTRGFSFQGDRPLDMAFNQEGHTSVATTTIVNRYPLDRLTYIFRTYGEEPKAYALAKKIIEKRKGNWIRTTGELLDIIYQVIKPNPRLKIHPATRAFQALRMETNRELESLSEVLPAAVNILKPGGKIAVVSFHSGEDRIVKDFFKTESKDCICPPTVPVCVCGHLATLKILTKKPTPASDSESNLNPRARSAKFRLAQKI